ncbi:acyl-CoA Delta-9 desaturase-like [Lutzomyia longipalpis]|uniref:acyl-CoA Delta-9 desaturase-like n=1 Tax=Lutzomyia longipalpis TaxID=7200 RepID=UPI0024835117|nr:acyl-CoA Delta-9 desaturase-like [Lutzomyia longipalpis]
MGAHRYFTHRTFKANIIIRRVLIVLFTMCGQNSLWQWVKDHRQHHKYSDTDADPHNARRGFFFSHVGWLISERHPKVLQYSKGIDMSDLEADSWIMFQNKYYFQVYAVVCVLIPCIIPIILWNEDPVKSFLVCYSARTCLSLTFTCFINSLAHTYGQRPYDKTILPRQNKFVSIFIAGEGWHNFHHAFPWDYRASELGTSFNLAANAIDFCAKMGWVYDLKTVSVQSLEKRIKKTGDNSHEKYGKQASKKLI